MNKTPHSQAPMLIIAVGNRSRGDDAIGPLLLEQLQQAEALNTDVEFIEDFQLQIEHALDLKNRFGVLFIDAALPDVVDGVSLVPIASNQDVLLTSHCLRAEAVLHVSKKVNGNEPPSWQLAIEGQHFELGEEVSSAGQKHMHQAFMLTARWLADRRRELAVHGDIRIDFTSDSKETNHA